MATVLPTITDDTAAFMHDQLLFFVGTAPLSGSGHVNVSPKGGAGSFRVVDEQTVAYRDMTGSGAETLAHVRENGRIVVMFCAFSGKPTILRLHGTGSVVTPGDEAWPHWVAQFPDHPGTRAVVVVSVSRVSTSCGFGVPEFGDPVDRTLLHDWAERRQGDRLDAYHRDRNATSIDGLPALPLPE